MVFVVFMLGSNYIQKIKTRNESGNNKNKWYYYDSYILTTGGWVIRDNMTIEPLRSQGA